MFYGVLYSNVVKILEPTMESKERRALEKAELRAKILAAARDLFADRGYEAVTMREIARKIGYTATALYYHFPDKDSLLRDLCETDFLALSDHFRSLADIRDPIARIRRLGRVYVDFGLKYPQHYRFMFMTPFPEPTPDQVRIEKGNPNQDAYAFLREAVKEGIEAGRFRPGLTDPDLVAQVIWGNVHGLVSLRLAWHGGAWVNWRSATESLELITGACLDGLLR